MKYFTKELCWMINVKEQREEADRRWNENCKAYHAYLDSSRGKLSKPLQATFGGAEPYHDCVIQEIRIKPGNRKKKSLEIVLQDGDEQVMLEMKDISSVQIDLQDFSDCIAGQLCWMYSEIEYLRGGKFRASLLFDLCNEMIVVFHSFRISKN